ncbi:hypothetical protein ACFXI6_14250 [Streptomyces mirabilis]|uniref:hypothetical protein n=1 Tax=Streptomyces mirabilis TaxID=68239 RepID=UPI0036B33A8B
MVYRDPRAKTTALDEINDLAGEYWAREDRVAQDIYDSVARELAQKLRDAGHQVAADLIDPGEEMP